MWWHRAETYEILNKMDHKQSLDWIRLAQNTVQLWSCPPSPPRPIAQEPLVRQILISTET